MKIPPYYDPRVVNCDRRGFIRLATGETEINVETNMQEREKERRMKS